MANMRLCGLAIIFFICVILMCEKHVYKWMQFNYFDGTSTRSVIPFWNVTKNISECAEKTLFYRADIEKAKHESIQGGPMDYLPNYRNPCWISKYNTSSWNSDGHQEPTAQNCTFGVTCKLRCLPAVYILGFAKSGTGDLFFSLKHPQLKTTTKEPLFWTLGRYETPSVRTPGFVSQSFEHYLSLFDRKADDIRTEVNDIDYHTSPLVDASSNYVYDSENWRQVPGQEELTEPRCTLAHTLRKLVPQAKLIITMRNPIQRAYSRYKMYKKHPTPANFHESVVKFLHEMSHCLQYQTIRGYAYNYTLFSTALDVGGNQEVGFSYLRASLYYVYINEWMSVFPRDQILTLKAEDYYADRIAVVKEIFEFLQLSLDPDHVTINWSKIADRPPVNTAESKGRSVEPMWDETEQLLSDFFKPYNNMLAELLGDERYRWVEE